MPHVARASRFEGSLTIDSRRPPIFTTARYWQRWPKRFLPLPKKTVFVDANLVGSAKRRLITTEPWVPGGQASSPSGNLLSGRCSVDPISIGKFRLPPAKNRWLSSHCLSGLHQFMRANAIECQDADTKQSCLEERCSGFGR